ncbi:MAG: hypothetical protein ACE5I5_13595 [Candidatus Heimdallarchaeota archaeon]
MKGEEFSRSIYGFDINPDVKNNRKGNPPVKVIFKVFTDDFKLSDETTPHDEFLYGDAYQYKWIIQVTDFLHVRFEVPSKNIDYQEDFSLFTLWLGFTLSTVFSLITLIVLYFLEEEEKQT